MVQIISGNLGEIVMIVRKIKSNELMEARNISSLCFHWSHDTKDMTPEAYFEKEMSQPKTADSIYWENTWASFNDEGEMMGCLSIPDFMAEFDGASYKMGGIEGVCTYPQFRRQGAIREIFKKALPHLYENGYTFSYLYAFSEAYYRRFGYEPTCHAIGMTYAMHTIPSEKYDGSFVLYRDVKQLEDFSRAYEVFASKYNMCIHRCEYDWKNVTSATPFNGKKSAYLYRDATGNPVGYLVIETVEEGGSTILHCSEIVFDTFQTLKALLSFAKTFQADYELVRIRVPNNLNLRYFCTDYSQSSSKIELLQNGMARVINVRKVLEGAAYIGSGNVAIRINDSIIKENEKDFYVEFSDGKCTNIIENQISEENEVDITMTISQFSAAILGTYEVADFEFLDIPISDKSIQRLKQVFYKKGCWINNFF